MFCHLIRHYFLSTTEPEIGSLETERCCIMRSWIITPHFHGPTFTPHAPQIFSRFCHKLRPYRLQININRTCKFFYSRISSPLSHTSHIVMCDYAGGVVKTGVVFSGWRLNLSECVASAWVGTMAGAEVGPWTVVTDTCHVTPRVQPLVFRRKLTR